MPKLMLRIHVACLSVEERHGDSRSLWSPYAIARASGEAILGDDERRVVAGGTHLSGDDTYSCLLSVSPSSSLPLSSPSPVARASGGGWSVRRRAVSWRVVRRWSSAAKPRSPRWLQSAESIDAGRAVGADSAHAETAPLKRHPADETRAHEDAHEPPGNQKRNDAEEGGGGDRGSPVCTHLLAAPLPPSPADCRRLHRCGCSLLCVHVHRRETVCQSAAAQLASPRCCHRLPTTTREREEEDRHPSIA